MTTVSRGITFGATEQVTNAKLHTLVDSATVSSIVDADISAAAAIDESKINFDGTTVCKLATTQTVTGNKTFSTLTNVYNMIGSLASINTIQSQTEKTNNLLVASLASITSVSSPTIISTNINSSNAIVPSMASLSYIRNTQINTNLLLASLASIGSLSVGTISGFTVGVSNTYVGTGAGNRAVAHGLGRKPVMVLITKSDGSYVSAILKDDLLVGLSGAGTWGYSVTAKDATNFYVGNPTDIDASMNKASDTYYWSAC